MCPVSRLIQPHHRVGNVLCFLLFNYILSTFGQYVPEGKVEAENLLNPEPNKRPFITKSEDSTYWYLNAESSLRSKIANEKKIEVLAKNVIFFLGDGMGVSTVTASRIHKGQLEGHSGEETQLNFEQLPNLAFAKTFCIDSQVADSACASTAFLSGILNNIATIGVTSNVLYGDCQAQLNKTNQVTSALAWAQARGMATGVVTTTRITHATPAATYSHVADRNWENDALVKASGENPDVCNDIAEQLIFGDGGKHINVIMGGGRDELLPNTVIDVESGQPGLRTDGKNLIETWIQSKKTELGKYVWNKQQLLNVDVRTTDYLLGLFAYDHMDYVLDANTNLDPSLAEMTRIAIDILSRNPNGYFLFVEGGRIDFAHHSNKAQKAFAEVLAFDDAISTGMEKTSEEETLLLVTADHSQGMTISGYPARGDPILGFAGVSDVDRLPYTTISYANGPGYKHPGPNGERYDITNDPLYSKETHTGEDVTVYSRGPFSHLLEGVDHQSYIPHVIAYAACLDIPGKGNLKGPHCPPAYVGGPIP